MGRHSCLGTCSGNLIFKVSRKTTEQEDGEVGEILQSEESAYTKLRGAQGKGECGLKKEVKESQGRKV